MKKILLTIAIVLTMGLVAGAQQSPNTNNNNNNNSNNSNNINNKNTNANRDTFFNDWEDIDNGMDRDGMEPLLPGSHGLEDDVEAPLGSGLLVLTALGGAYLLRRREK